MTSFLFGQAPGDYVVGDDGSGGLVFKPGSVLVGWNMRDGGSNYGMTSDAAYTIPLPTWTADDSGHPNPAYGPDEIKQMWVSADGGPRVLMTASDVAAALGDRIAGVTNSAGQPNGYATLNGNGQVPSSQLPGGLGGSIKLGDLSDVDAAQPADGAVPAYSAADSVYEVTSALDAVVRSPALVLGAQPDPLIKFVSDHVPDASDQNMMEFWSSYSGVEKLVAWLNERGMYRAEQIPGGTGWETPVKSIVNVAGTGDAVGIERRNADNSRTQIGGVNVRGLLITSLQEWVPVTMIDPGATGKYVAATSDYQGDAFDSLAVRYVTDDVIEIRGLIGLADSANPSGQDVLCTLPDGFAPTAARAFCVGTSFGKGVPIKVLPNGDVLNTSGQGTSGAVGTYYLDGQTFRR